MLDGAVLCLSKIIAIDEVLGAVQLRGLEFYLYTRLEAIKTLMYN